MEVKCGYRTNERYTWSHNGLKWGVFGVKMGVFGVFLGVNVTTKKGGFVRSFLKMPKNAQKWPKMGCFWGKNGCFFTFLLRFYIENYHKKIW